MLPNRITSANPVVNGSKSFTTECTRCGQRGHYSRSCTNPELQKWEQLAFPRESNSVCLSVQSIHDLEYNRSCDYFFAGLLPEESHKATLPSGPVPLGWKSKLRRRLEQASYQNPIHMNYRPPTPPVNSSHQLQNKIHQLAKLTILQIQKMMNERQ